MEAATFTGQGCALSQASASLLTGALPGRDLAAARELAALVRRLLAGAALSPDEISALGELEALRGATQFPQRIRCASLVWQALDRALDSARQEPPPA